MVALGVWGWATQPMGQAAMSPTFCRRLQRSSSLVRWFPDLIAVAETGDGSRFVFVDAKAGGEGYPNHSIELKSIECMEALQAAFGHTGYYVTAEWTVLTTADVRRHGTHHDGRGARGSRTPFVIVPKTIGVPFQSVFADGGSARRPAV